MGMLGLAAFLFLVTHLGLSARPVRKRLVALMGEKLFIPFYSAISFLTLGWTIHQFTQAPVNHIWETQDWARVLALVVMPFALLLAVAGFSTRNPTAVYQGEALAAAKPAPGILSVTRHPVMWAFMLWAIVHMIANGRGADLILFGSLLLVAALGTLHQEAKRRIDQPEVWARFAAQTSHIPFAAALAGRSRVDWAGIGLVRPLVALALYALLLWAHGRLFGVAPI
ncbi:MAG: NnrU family protein [Rhodospirillales bacterium]|nr:NnrU family protein [Rhodospirillales bacterium]